MRKLPLARDIGYWILGISLFFVFSKTIHAQEIIEIPGPELKDASFIEVKSLQIGDWVFVKGEEGLTPEKIIGFEYKQEQVEVYNLSVDGEETFFANDFAVHNKAGIDSTKPQCRVIVNPTIENANGLVQNRSFETAGDPVWCPRFWYNRENGGWWCDYGLEIKSAHVCGGCGNKVVELGYPHFLGRQDISGLVPFGSQKVLYRVSAYGRGGNAKLYFREIAGSRWGTFTFLCFGCASNRWGHQSLLGWANSNSEPIIIMGETRFDLVSLQKLTGSTQVTSSEVNLFVAFYDNRNVSLLRHWNQGESPPDWDSEDPRVIGFGPIYPNANGISHTLTGSGSRTINVQVRDYSGNVSNTCSVTVNYTPPTGTITGSVYSDHWGGCDGTDSPPDGWVVECGNALYGYYDAEKTGDTTYECRNSEGGSELPHGDYIVRFKTIPEDWEGIEACDDHLVNLNDDSEIAPNLCLWEGLGPWFQTKEGDVHIGGRIVSRVPLASEYFCAADAGDYPGLVSYDNTDELPDFGRHDSTPSEKGWLAKDDFSRYGYTSFERTLDYEPDSFDALGGSKPGPGESGVYHSSNPQTTSNTWIVNPGEWYIILIDNDLTIDHRIDVDPGGFLAFIVSGDITVSDSVGVTCGSSSTNGIQGVFITDQTFTSGTTDTQLRAEGIFVAQNFVLDRTCGENDDTYPAELFIARPDLFVNIPNDLKESYFFEQEVAP